jgi:hypothetical protein
VEAPRHHRTAALSLDVTDLFEEERVQQWVEVVDEVQIKEIL